jgi:hypothetical protein
MPTFDRLSGWLQRLWARSSDSRYKQQPPPPISYPKFSIVQQPPRNQDITNGSVTIVASSRQPKWAMFLCPCGCQSVITLTLQSAKRPHWNFQKSKGGRPTLHPSVWRDVGCMSHFVLEDGRIFWCNDSGVSPEEFRARRNSLRGESATD